MLDRDYRNINGTFDKLVSIEMIEAVGHHYLNTFFRCCSRLLKCPHCEKHYLPDARSRLPVCPHCKKEYRAVTSEERRKRGE